MFGADGVVAPESLNPSQIEEMEDRSFILSTGNETFCQGTLCLLTRAGLIRVSHINNGVDILPLWLCAVKVGDFRGVPTAQSCIFEQSHIRLS